MTMKIPIIIVIMMIIVIIIINHRALLPQVTLVCEKNCWNSTPIPGHHLNCHNGQPKS